MNVQSTWLQSHLALKVCNHFNSSAKTTISAPDVLNLPDAFPKDFKLVDGENLPEGPQTIITKNEKRQWVRKDIILKQENYGLVFRDLEETGKRLCLALAASIVCLVAAAVFVFLLKLKSVAAVLLVVVGVISYKVTNPEMKRLLSDIARLGDLHILLAKKYVQNYMDRLVLTANAKTDAKWMTFKTVFRDTVLKIFGGTDSVASYINEADPDPDANIRVLVEGRLAKAGYVRGGSSRGYLRQNGLCEG